MAEVVQAAGGIEPAALVQVVPGVLRTCRAFNPVGVEDGKQTERVVNIALDGVDRVIYVYSKFII
ncbi:MAG: hypothetical protein KatS3mg109_0569 [Pirellulaceae bacterium]|nr:MAG: hypothetical protein KatS3mg109_0569 [Pirellulaceae bacterium]